MKAAFSVALVVVFSVTAWAAAPRTAPATALQFSPDGTALVSGGYRSIRIQPRGAGAPRTLPCGLSQVQSLQFSPQGTLLTVGGGTAGETGAAVLLDWPSGKPRRTLAGHKDLVTCVAFNPDGTRLATASADATVRVWDLGGTALAPAVTLVGHAGPVLGAAYSPDGTLIVTASADRSLKVWDAKSGALQRSLTNHTDIVHSVAFRPPNTENRNPSSYCVSASDDRTVRVWQPGIGRMVRIIRGHPGPALTVLYSRDGSRIYSAAADGVIRDIDAESDEILRTWKAGDGWIYSLALSPDGKVLATGDWSGKVRSWDLRASRR